jgi:hypothetical protein
MMKRIRKVWALRVAAEYRSAALTAELLHWLIAIAVSPDTLEMGHRIVSDELAHAELSRDVFLAAGGELSQIPIVQQTMFLRHAPGSPIELRALAAVADVFCCGETVAVPLFHGIRAGAEEEQVVAVLTRIMQDEATHRAFGWQTLDELLERTGAQGKAWVADRVSTYVRQIRAAYASTETRCTPTERRWGLMPPADYGQITATCVDEVVIPWFARRGLPVRLDGPDMGPGLPLV